MSGKRHRIRRQVLEVTIQDQDAAWQLQSELGRIQSRSLEAIIDRCCTEAGDPDRLHRIESLEVDLGQIDLDNLERDLVAKLGARLREALSARIRAEDDATSLAGADPETNSRLELVAFFAKTGNLPWWADVARPRLLDDTVRVLLARAAGPLVALVRTLARDRRELRRLVLHCEEEQLRALFEALVASAPPGLAHRSAELRALLTAHGAIAGIMHGRFRSAVWLAVLRAASIEQGAGAGPVSFWRGAMAHIALELGVTYTSLVTQLHEDRVPGLGDKQDALGVIVQSLYREVRGEAVASDSTLREHELKNQGVAASLPAAALEEARRLLREASEEQGYDGVPNPVLDTLRYLDRQTLTHGPSAPETSVRDSAPAGDSAPAADSAPAGDSAPAADSAPVGDSALAADSAPAADSDAPAADSDAPAADSDARRDDSPPAQTLETERRLRRATSAKTAESTDELPRLDLAYGDSEDAYVENAGLVILWPFLGHLFDRLELMEDKQFKDRSALHRAVGLLQHLVTEDPSPPEYQLVLAKVLCGMDMKDVFDFGPPVTEAEAEECTNLLTAVIANAPILKEMSIAGFRGSFLLRKGVLGTRDGSWLLRVERVTYDVVLDRFPWGMSWVKLPWMEAPLCVEW